MAWGIMMAVVSLVGTLVVAVASQSSQEDAAPSVSWEWEYYPEQIDHQLWTEPVVAEESRQEKASEEFRLAA